MMTKKWPSMPEEKLKRLQDYWEHGTSVAGIDKAVVDHLSRMRTMGGEGVDMMSGLNKDYLGSFMAPLSRDLGNADLVVVGLPFEKAAPMQASHKFGPSGIRRLSKNKMGTTEPWDGGFDIPFDECRIIDYGNVDTYGQFDLSAEMDVVLKHMKRIVTEHGCNTLVFGGDHTTSYAPIHVLGQKYGPLGLIHFDAHYDLVTYADFPYPYHSGNQFTKNMAEGNLDPERMITMGIRGPMTALVGGHAKQLGVTTLFADECRDYDPKDMANKIIDVVGEGPTYLSFDLDALDSVANSSSSAVEPFGLDHIWVYDVLRHLRRSKRIDLVGADVVEYTPYTDPTLKDGYLAAAYAWFLLRWLATEVSRRNGEKRLTVWPQGFGHVSL